MSEEKRGLHAPTILGGMGGALLGGLFFAGLGVGPNFVDGLSFSDVILFAVYLGFIVFGGFVAESLRPRGVDGRAVNAPEREADDPDPPPEATDTAPQEGNRVATIASRLWTTAAIVGALLVGGTGLFFLLVTIADDTPPKNAGLVRGVAVVLMVGGPLAVYGIYRWGYWLFRR